MKGHDLKLNDSWYIEIGFNIYEKYERITFAEL